MLKFLFKKQMMEAFRGFFIKHKTGEKKSKKGTIVSIVLFASMLVFLFGGMFTMLSIAMCKSMSDGNAEWLFFLVMMGISIISGVFGSVFNTYSGLYMAKDNDMLLSMPIKISDIIISRLLNIYLLGAVFTLPVFIPAIIVDWCVVGINFAKVIGGLAITIVSTLIVFILSCILGWIIAKVRTKIKRRSTISVLIALTLIGLYYFLYFKMSEIIKGIAENAAIYGTIVHDKAYPLYLLGSMGEGNLIGTLIYLVVTFAITYLIYILLKKTFIKLVTSTGKGDKKVNKVKDVKTKSIFRTVLAKEFGRFTSSANYILNSGMGLVFVIAVAVMMAIKGNGLIDALAKEFPLVAKSGAILLSVTLMMTAGMVDTAAPSVSLEGKNIWVLQSLPIDPFIPLFAKAMVQWLLTVIPTTIALVIASIFVNISAIDIVLLFILMYSFLTFSAIFNTTMSVVFANLGWTNELYPIKQSAPVFFGIFGMWVLVAIFGFGYLLVASFMSAVIYMLIFSVVFTILSILLTRYLKTKGAVRFAHL